MMKMKRLWLAFNVLVVTEAEDAESLEVSFFFALPGMNVFSTLP
jgi:hypothetical protein